MEELVALLIGWLEENAGLTTDAASPTGSLHAKIKDVADNKIGDSADVRADNTVLGWLATPIKSIQRGATSVTTDGDTQSISAVVMAKSIVVLGGHTSNLTSSTDAGASLERANVKVTLTSTTQLTFNVHDDSDSNSVSWQVIEFY